MVYDVKDSFLSSCLLSTNEIFQVMRPRKHGPPKAGFSMQKPGALHHARFLSRCLYFIKLAMLTNALPRNFLTPNMQSQVKQIVEYIVLFHAPHFLKARLATAAPRLDLEL